MNVKEIRVPNYDVNLYEDEDGRMGRMENVFNVYKACMDTTLNQYNNRKRFKLSTLCDHEGNLNVGWRAEPSEEEIRAIELAWNLQGECCILHGMNPNDESRNFYFWDKHFKSENY